MCGMSGHRFDLESQQQFAFWVERPGVRLAQILVAVDAPDGRSRRLRAHAARAFAQPFAHTDAVDRIATRFDKRPHRFRRLGLAEQDTVYAPRQDLAELPGVKAYDLSGRPFDRRLDDDGRCAVTAACGPAVDQTAHVLVQPGHVEGAVFHAHVDVVGPGSCIFHALFMGEDVARVPTDIVDRLVLGKQFDGSVDSG